MTALLVGRDFGWGGENPANELHGSAQDGLGSPRGVRLENRTTIIPGLIWAGSRGCKPRGAGFDVPDWEPECVSRWYEKVR